jgi:hypothetical protein
MNYELLFVERMMVKQWANTINKQRERLKAFYNPARLTKKTSFVFFVCSFHPVKFPSIELKL